MKTPPPPYYEVAMATNQMIANIDESQLNSDITNRIPPTYQINNHLSISPTSETNPTANTVNHTNGANLPNTNFTPPERLHSPQQ